VGCSVSAEKQAMTESDTLRTWNALYRSYKAYRQCDDGAISEGYSESVARILVDHWDTLPHLDLLARKDAGFRRFVLEHLDATLNMDDVELVRKRAKAKCPSGLRRLCDDLTRRADETIKENASPQ
jgi:hypothetical protein